MVFGLWKNQTGSLLIETILVTFLFGVMATGLVSTLLTSVTSAKQGAEYIVATGYLQEGIEAVRSIRDQDWATVSGGTHGLQTTNGHYEFSGVSNLLDAGVYTRTITVDPVFRTGGLTGDIAEVGVLDENTKKVTVTVSWDVQAGRNQNIHSIFYVTNWGIQAWLQTLTADFSAGRRNGTQQTTAVDGEVKLSANNNTWENMEASANIDLPGGTPVVALQIDSLTDTIYTLATSTAGADFNAVDLSNVSTSAPTVMSGYDANNCYDMVVSANTAYLACDELGPGVEVVILDVQTMTALGTINLPSTNRATSIAITGSTLIIGRVQSGSTAEVYFYNVTDPANSALLGSTETGISVADLGTNGTYTFLATANDAQEVMSIRNSDRTLLSSINLSSTNNATTVQVVGSNVYVGRDNGSSYEIALVNGSNPVVSLTLTSSLEVGLDVKDLFVDSTNTWLFASTSGASSEGIVVNLSGFTQLATINMTGSNTATAVEMFGGFVYLGTNVVMQDLVAFEVSEQSWSSMQVVSTTNLALNDNASRVVVVGTKTYVGRVDSGGGGDLVVYDTTVPSNPVLLGSFDVGATISDMVISGNYAYLATDTNARELDIISISNPASMVRTGSYNMAGNANALSVFVSGTTAYLGRASSSDNEFWVINVATVATPSLTGSLNFASDINDLVKSGNYIFGATSSDTQEIAVFNVTTPASPTLGGSFNATGSMNANAIDVSGTLLALGRSSGTGNLGLFDLTTPTSPTALIQTTASGSINALHLVLTTNLFLATDFSTGEAQYWNIASPASSVLLSSLNLPGTVNGVTYNGTNAFYAGSDNASELQILGQNVITMTDFVKEGNFTSQVFDSTSASTNWDSMSWITSGTGTTVYRIRTADTQANLETASWVGSDGTSSSSYSVSGTSITVDPNASGTRWIQWKAYQTGNGVTAPVLENVSLYYSP